VIGEATSAIYSKLPEINKIPHIGNSVKYLAGAGIISALYILSYSNASKIAILSFNVTVQLIDITIHLTMLSIVGFMDGASRNMTNSVDQKEQLQYHLSTELIRNIAGVGERGASVIQSIYESYQMQRDVIKQVDTALKGQEIEEAVSSTPSYISKVWQLECKKAMLYIFGMSKEGQLDNKSIRVVDEVASAFSAAIKSADSGIYAMVYRICFGIGQERAAHLAKDQGQTSAVKI
jgi:hypothetical protein